MAHQTRRNVHVLVQLAPSPVFRNYCRDYTRLVFQYSYRELSTTSGTGSGLSADMLLPLTPPNLKITLSDCYQLEYFIQHNADAAGVQY